MAGCRAAAHRLSTSHFVPFCRAIDDAPVMPQNQRGITGANMITRLTEPAINAAVRQAAETRKRIELTDAGQPGLRLRITPAGARSWVLGCRDQHGRARRFPLGDYPALGIREAREKARTTRNQVKEGADPVAERRRTRALAEAARRGEGTLRALLDSYGQDAGAVLRSWGRSRPCVERVFAALLDRPLTTLSIPELLLKADSYPAKPSAAFAVRTLRPVLKWAAARQYVTLDLSAFHRKAPVRARQRVLDRTELARLLPALRASGRPHASALLFMLLTLARKEEVCGARWSHVDQAAKLWTIPRTKNGTPHQVPLSRQALALLARLRGQDVRPEDPVFAVRRRGASDRGERSPLGNWDRETKAVQAASETTGWHRHDLRRTGATLLGELGELPDIIEAALNHTAIRSALAATYNRSRYRPAVASALQRLADELDAIERPESSPIPGQ